MGLINVAFPGWGESYQPSYVGVLTACHSKVVLVCFLAGGETTLTEMPPECWVRGLGLLRGEKWADAQKQMMVFLQQYGHLGKGVLDPMFLPPPSLCMFWNDYRQESLTLNCCCCLEHA